MSFEFGDVVLVRFPFTNQRDAKKRPAVVVSSARYQNSRPDVVILALTSRVPTAPDFGTHVLSGWRQAGLVKPTATKPLLATIEQSLVERTLGRLEVSDQEGLRRVLDDVIG